MTAIIVILVVIGGFAGGFMSIYKKLLSYVAVIEGQSKEIDELLEQRYKAFTLLIDIIKNYPNYTNSPISNILTLRAKAQKALEDGAEISRITAEDAISNIASTINTLPEQLPEVKSNEAAMHLLEEITNTQNKLSYAIHSYNDHINQYNETRKSFLDSLVVGMYAQKLEREFTLWHRANDQENA